MKAPLIQPLTKDIPPLLEPGHIVREHLECVLTSFESQAEGDSAPLFDFFFGVAAE